MASNSDGSVVIEIDLTAKEAEQELSRLKKKILRLNESLYVGEHKKSSLVAQLKEAEQELDNLQKKTTIGTGFSAQIDPADVARISELKNIISSTTDQIKKTGCCKQEGFRNACRRKKLLWRNGVGCTQGCW